MKEHVHRCKTQHSNIPSPLAGSSIHRNNPRNDSLGSQLPLFRQPNENSVVSMVQNNKMQTRLYYLRKPENTTTEQLQIQSPYPLSIPEYQKPRTPASRSQPGRSSTRLGQVAQPLMQPYLNHQQPRNIRPVITAVITAATSPPSARHIHIKKLFLQYVS